MPAANSVLTRAQRAALDFVTDRATARAPAARAQIAEILRMSDIDSEQYERALGQLKSHARVALHFHPDRPCPNLSKSNEASDSNPDSSRGDQSVAALLLADGVYRSQFETGISNGGLSAHRGGARAAWETRLFGDAYDRPESAPTERPKYGALNVMLQPDGPSPRFGSCFFLLSKDVSDRCSFTYQDSHEDPDEKATYEAFDDVASALFGDAFKSEFALGEHDLSPSRLLEHLTNRIGGAFLDPASLAPRRNLNHYIEAQVHGDVSLAKDAEILVADPSFAGTEIGEKLEALRRRYDVALYWHAGFALALEDIPIDFRGPTMPSLARRVSTAGSGYIDVEMIGRAVVALRNDPESFADRGTFDEALQELKLLWHVLVRHGQPLREFRSIPVVDGDA